MPDAKVSPRRALALGLPLAAIAAACSGAGAGAGGAGAGGARDLGAAGGAGGAGAGGARDLGAAGGGGAGGGDGADAGGTTRDDATRAVAMSDPACTALPAFYWEIGDRDGALVSGQVGHVFAADTTLAIASASKLVFGAYVVQRFKDDLGQIDLRAMTMQSGYTSLDYTSCVNAATVADCLLTGSNGDHVAANDGFFFYNGGHFQKYAVDLGLGGDDNAALAAAMLGQIGGELPIDYGSPQLAAGVRASASGYALFLRKILRGELAISAHLGENAVCTLPGTCAQALSSPSPLAWHYSYGHWVEDEPGTGDGAFSSPGAFGFYPWIDASKRYYGIVARYALKAEAAVESSVCGRALRKAFLTASP